MGTVRAVRSLLLTHGPLVVVFVAAVAVLGAMAGAWRAVRYGHNPCAMSYSFPVFNVIPLCESAAADAAALCGGGDIGRASCSRLGRRYSLIRFTNGYEVKAAPPESHPVLFVPGHQGSYKQVRSLAAALLSGEFPLDVYTLDFREESTALFGSLLWDQAEFINDGVRAILARRVGAGAAASVTIIAHSIGGMAARAAPLLPNYSPRSIANIITLGTPHTAPPVRLDADMMALYDLVNERWRGGLQQATAAPTNASTARMLNREPGDDDIAVLSISSGEADTQIWEDSTRITDLGLLDARSGAPLGPPLSHNANPGKRMVGSKRLAAGWLSSQRIVAHGIDHWAILWCKRFVEAVSRGVSTLAMQCYSGDLTAVGESSGSGSSSSAELHPASCSALGRLKVLFTALERRPDAQSSSSSADAAPSLSPPHETLWDVAIGRSAASVSSGVVLTATGLLAGAPYKYGPTVLAMVVAVLALMLSQLKGMDALALSAGVPSGVWVGPGVNRLQQQMRKSGSASSFQAAQPPPSPRSDAMGAAARRLTRSSVAPFLAELLSPLNQARMLVGLVYAARASAASVAAEWLRRPNEHAGDGAAATAASTTVHRMLQRAAALRGSATYVALGAAVFLYWQRVLEAPSLLVLAACYVVAVAVIACACAVAVAVSSSLLRARRAAAFFYAWCGEFCASHRRRGGGAVASTDSAPSSQAASPTGRRRSQSSCLPTVSVVTIIIGALLAVAFAAVALTTFHGELEASAAHNAWMMKQNADGHTVTTTAAAAAALTSTAGDSGTAAVGIDFDSIRVVPAPGVIGGGGGAAADYAAASSISRSGSSGSSSSSSAGYVCAVASDSCGRTPGPVLLYYSMERMLRYAASGGAWSAWGANPSRSLSTCAAWLIVFSVFASCVKAFFPMRSPVALEGSAAVLRPSPSPSPSSLNRVRSHSSFSAVPSPSMATAHDAAAVPPVNEKQRGDARRHRQRATTSHGAPTNAAAAPADAAPNATSGASSSSLCGEAAAVVAEMSDARSAPSDDADPERQQLQQYGGYSDAANNSPTPPHDILEAVLVLMLTPLWIGTLGLLWNTAISLNPTPAAAAVTTWYGGGGASGLIRTCSITLAAAVLALFSSVLVTSVVVRSGPRLGGVKTLKRTQPAASPTRNDSASGKNSSSDVADGDSTDSDGAAAALTSPPEYLAAFNALRRVLGPERVLSSNSTPSAAAPAHFRPSDDTFALVKTTCSSALDAHASCDACVHEEGGVGALYRDVSESGSPVAPGVWIGTTFRVVSCDCWERQRRAAAAEARRAAAAAASATRGAASAAAAAAAPKFQPCEYCACVCLACGGDAQAADAASIAAAAAAISRMSGRPTGSSTASGATAGAHDSLSAALSSALSALARVPLLTWGVGWRLLTHGLSTRLGVSKPCCGRIQRVGRLHPVDVATLQSVCFALYGAWVLAACLVEVHRLLPAAAVLAAVTFLLG